MRANLKGMSGIKGLLLKHCEKIGMVVVAICAVMFVMKSIGRDRLPPENQPTQLEDLVSRTKSKVTQFDWSDAPPEEKKEAISFVKDGASSVRATDFEAFRLGMDRLVVSPTVLRTDPELLPPMDLEVNVGSGLLAFVDENVRRQRELEALREREERDRERANERDRAGDERDAGRGGRGERGGGERGGRFGREEVDPNHPNRRSVNTRRRPAGVATMGDERIERAHWAAIVAKVPIEDQLKRFRDALEDAKNYQPGADCPEYRGYYVQRAEVIPGEEPKWRALFTGADSTLDTSIKDWANLQQEVIDAPYFNPLLTFPLPPLVGRDWKYDATHSEIPLAADVIDEPFEEELEEAQPELAEDDPNFFIGDDDLTSRRSRLGGGGGRGGRGEGGYDSYDGGGFDSYEDGRGGYEDYGGRGGEYMDGGRGGRGGQSGRGGRGGRGAGRGAVNAICTAEVPSLLFRFYDFTAQPGRRYQYRVRLVLTDVNQGVSSSALDNSVIERIAKQGEKPSPVRFSSWSDPSPVVQIPIGGGSVRTVSARPPVKGSLTSEPEVTLLVQSFGVDEVRKPIEAAKEKVCRRGSVANMIEEAEVLVENGRWIDKVDPFTFHTDIVVLDIDGGDRLARDLNVPARVLLMDSAGRMYIRNELDDLEDVEEHEMIFSEEDTGRGGRGGDGRGGYDEGGRGGGFERF